MKRTLPANIHFGCVYLQKLCCIFQIEKFSPLSPPQDLLPFFRKKKKLTQCLKLTKNVSFE